MSGIVGNEQGKTLSGYTNTTSKMGSFRDADTFKSDVDGFMAYNTSTSWASIADESTCPFPNKRYDHHSSYNTTHSRHYPNKSGLYFYSASIYSGQSDDSNSFAFILDGSINDDIIGPHHQGDWGLVGKFAETEDQVFQLTAFIFVNRGQNVRVVSMGGASDFYPGHSFWSGTRVR